MLKTAPLEICLEGDSGTRKYGKCPPDWAGHERGCREGIPTDGSREARGLENQPTGAQTRREAGIPDSVTSSLKGKQEGKQEVTESDGQKLKITNTQEEREAGANRTSETTERFKPEGETGTLAHLDCGRLE